MAAWPICGAPPKVSFSTSYKRFPFASRLPNRCLQFPRQLDQRFALDSILQIDNAHRYGLHARVI